jgi:hypothetical protein
VRHHRHLEGANSIICPDVDVEPMQRVYEVKFSGVDVLHSFKLLIVPLNGSNGNAKAVAEVRIEQGDTLILALFALAGTYHRHCIRPISLNRTFEEKNVSAPSAFAAENVNMLQRKV